MEGPSRKEFYYEAEGRIKKSTFKNATYLLMSLKLYNILRMRYPFVYTHALIQQTRSSDFSDTLNSLNVLRDLESFSFRCAFDHVEEGEVWRG